MKKNRKAAAKTSKVRGVRVTATNKYNLVIVLSIS